MKNILTPILLFAALATPATWADDDAAMKDTFGAAIAGESVLRQHIAAGGDLNATDDDGETALMEAADEGIYRAVHLLIMAGADVNAVDKDGETALMKAAEEGHANIVQRLLAGGANPALKDKKGRTAADHATKKGHANIVELISVWAD